MAGFYIQNFALRLLFCIAIAAAAANLGIYVRDVVLSHGTFGFDLVRSVLLPLGLGTMAALLWKPKA